MDEWMAFSPPSSTGAGAGDRRPRLVSYPPLREGSGEASPEAEAEAERSEGEEERGQFRSRSSSAPPILWAARRYGSELRRMSDEFDCTFKVPVEGAQVAAGNAGCFSRGLLLASERKRREGGRERRWPEAKGKGGCRKLGGRRDECPRWPIAVSLCSCLTHPYPPP